MVKIFASTLADFPAIFKGDVLRLHRAEIKKTSKNNKSCICIQNEKDVVIFPLDERKEPHTAAAHYAITEDDMKTVQRLRSLKFIKMKQGMNQASGTPSKV